MKLKQIIGLILLCACLHGMVCGQTQNNGMASEQATMTIKGVVYDKATYKPYEDVEILVAGGQFTRSKLDGSFEIKAKIGDELIISHKDFEPIYHTISSSERIKIEVVNENKKRQTYRSDRKVASFNALIDSANAYLKRDAEKSIRFIGDALDMKISTLQSSTAHELLGDVYMYWKQYDLAISAYKVSIQNSDIPSRILKLGKAYLKNEQPELSLSTFRQLDTGALSIYQNVLRFEGIGDAELARKNYSKAVVAFEQGLSLAQEHLISPKITDLNSKIAEAYSKTGEKDKAKNFYSNSLRLANKENKKRAVEEQVKVAEFNSDIRDFDSEIELRKQAVETIEDIERDSVIPIESPITSQKQNYKIGSAYMLANDLDKAIPYLEKSIEEANKREDLVVKKDATRKLSEALLSKGETEEGLNVLNKYKDVVDELYAKREQEISQAARFSRNISEQQNRIASLESDRRLSLSKYELTQERNKRQQLIIYSLIGGLVLLLITGYLMYKYIRQQRFANNLLALKSLRSQMNPHFIFNALNSVNSFIATNDERTANKYLSDFSFLMRSVLENSEEDFIPLQKEIELIELYTKLEHFRFQDKFSYHIEINDTINIEEFDIPPMLLQPYIENAVWHGLRYKQTKGFLEIAIKARSKEQIVITISDNGIGRERSKALKTEHQKKQKSKGMNNIKKRVAILNEMYKDKIEVSVEDFQKSEDTGTKVTVTLNKN